MRITYLIGNGFDLGLGLSTGYQSFIAWYLAQPSENKQVVWLKEHINESLEQWSDAELAFGALNFSEGGGDSLFVYDKCYDSFTNGFHKYLTEQNKRLQILKEKQGEVVTYFLKNILKLWPFMADRCSMEYKQSLYQTSSVEITFVTFNYTDSLEQMLGLAQNATNEFSIECEKGHVIKVIVKEVIHAHGTLTSDYVFGVDIPAQIADKKVRASCERRGGMLKARSLEKIGLMNRSKALRALHNSNVVVTYGLSFGDTDGSWWSELYAIFRANIRLIICPYRTDLPDSGWSVKLRGEVFDQEKKRVFATMIKRNPDLNDEIESIDAPRIVVLHPQKVSDGLGKVHQCDFFRLKYIGKKYVRN